MPDVFWQSSVLEIQDMMEAYQNSRKQQFKDRVLIGFAEADAIATRVAYFFSDSKKRRDGDIVQPWDSFPALFEDQRQTTAERRQNAEMQKFKADMKAYAERWNRRQKDGSETGI